MRTTKALVSVALLLGVTTSAQALNIGETVYATGEAQLELPGQVVAHVPQSAPLKVELVHGSGDWVWTVHNGREGWIHRASIRTTPVAVSKKSESFGRQSCAELGSERCRMIHPTDGETESHCVCRAWVWDSEDGWGWSWSSLHCPWNQCDDCGDD